jgi:hypothetical protein
MAIGDIPGDMKATGQDFTPEQRAARQAALTQGSAPSSLATFPISAPPTGPIGRAQQQLPSAGIGSANLGVPGQDDTGAQSAAAQQQPRVISSLNDPSFGLSSQGNAQQTSFDSTNTPSNNPPPAAQPNQVAQLTNLGQINPTPFDPVSAAQQPSSLTDAFKTAPTAPSAVVAPPATSPPPTQAAALTAQQAPTPLSSLYHANLVTPAHPDASSPGVFSTDPFIKNQQINAWRGQSSLTQLGSQAVGMVKGTNPPAVATTQPAPSGPSLLSPVQQPAAAVQSDTAQPAAPSVVADPVAAPTGPLLSDQYRPTGIGAGAKGGQIVAQVGPNGEPQFSNIKTDQQSAQGLGQISVSPNPQPASTQPSTLATAGGIPASTPASPPDFASLGSAGNLGDGIGTFSQALPGDAALAAGRFAKANEIYQGTRNQSRLDQALGAQWSADHTNIVHDSSRPLSTAQQQSDIGLQQTRNQAAGDVKTAQGLISANLSNQAGEQQLRQASRLEDLQVAATAPGATAVDQQNYLRAKDPAAFLKLQIEAPQKAADLAKTQAQTSQTLQKTSFAGTTQQQAQQDRAKAISGQTASVDMALASVNKILGTKTDPKNPNGPMLNEDKGLASSVGLRSAFPTLPGTAASDFEARNETLKAQTFLPQVSLLKGMGALSNAEGEKLGASIGSLSTKQSPDAYRANLKIIADAFGKTRERIMAGNLIAPGSNQEFAQPISFGAQAATAKSAASPIDHSSLWGD